MAGYIQLYRDIQEHWLWQEKPFSKGQAWIDLLMMANHEENKVILGNEIILVERGCLITSEVKLAERWGWSRHKVRDFLNLLQKDSMIDKKSDTKRTYLKILNYNVWQNSKTAKEQQKDSAGTSKGHQKDTNNNDKNDNNDKNNKNNILSDSEQVKKFSEQVKEIVDYLNQKAGTAYKVNSRKTRDLIKARFNEDFTVEDFKKVIDNKIADWNHEPRPGEKDMRPYLRPETLFGTKFESYLNSRPAVKSVAHRNNFQQRDYSDDFFDQLNKSTIIVKASGGDGT